MHAFKISLSVIIVSAAVGGSSEAGSPLYSGPSPAARATLCASNAAAEIYNLFNTPSTLCQCAGFGVGPGYHAKMIVGPGNNFRTNPHGMTMLPGTPRANYTSCWCHASPGPGGTALTGAPVHYHQHYLPQAPPRQLFSAPPLDVPEPVSTESIYDDHTPDNDGRQEPASPSDSNGADDPDPDALPMPTI
mgnify:CR=1 FL=1